MLAKEKFCRLVLFKKIIFFSKITIIYLFTIATSFADLQKNIINKLILTKTISFDFQQKVEEKEEEGICFIKYPLLMKCKYKNTKGKILISNGKSIAIIKKKYKKIYRYPIESTPLFIILNKDKVLNLIRNTQPSKMNSNTIEFEFTDKKLNRLIILFNSKTLEFKGWKTVDAYSNNVSFIISNTKTNNQIVDSFFIIPKEEDL
jgi:outer membrane lipoprotein-sorting protein